MVNTGLSSRVHNPPDGHNQVPAVLDLTTLLPSGDPSFRTHEEVRAPIQAACAEHADLATFHALGKSEEGRPLYGVVLGRGEERISLIAGAHSDEPVGPETLRTFVLEGLRQRERLHPLFERFRFVVVPHVNPDGEARNRPWITQWPSLPAYLRHAFREPPGRDLEFGFPAMRPENRAVSAFLEAHAPFWLHASLHGMGVAEGVQLLIERRWTFRTERLQEGFARAAEEAGLSLHDHNRKGEKGFFYVAPGFTTTPEGEAMRAFFRAQGDEAMAGRFHDSSMEFARRFGGDPLCLVTELPLFVIDPRTPHEPGHPANYLALRARLPGLREQARQGDEGAIASAAEAFGLRPLPLRTAQRLQLRTIHLGLETVAEALSARARP